jgi:hypothetical protein
MNSYFDRLGGRASRPERIAIARGLERFHRYLRLAQLDAPQMVLDHAQVLIDQSLIELDCSERDLAELIRAIAWSHSRATLRRRRRSTTSSTDCPATFTNEPQTSTTRRMSHC